MLKPGKVLSELLSFVPWHNLSLLGQAAAVGVKNLEHLETDALLSYIRLFDKTACRQALHFGSWKEI